MNDLLSATRELMDRGGVVMWPLLAMSLVSLTLVLERAIYFARVNSPSVKRALGEALSAWRQGQHDQARKHLSSMPGLYGELTQRLWPNDQESQTPDTMSELLRLQPRVERFMGTLSTIITAAPMLGILGTVLGIISSFDAVSQGGGRVDLSAVAGGIAEALITTAVGMVVAIATLFPYNALRTQVQRTLGRLEAIASAAESTNPDPISAAREDLD